MSLVVPSNHALQDTDLTWYRKLSLQTAVTYLRPHITSNQLEWPLSRGPSRRLQRRVNNLSHPEALRHQFEHA